MADIFDEYLARLARSGPGFQVPAGGKRSCHARTTIRDLPGRRPLSGGGEATVKLLRHFGAEVDYPAGQTCCGQPAFNAGYRAEAAAAARHFLDIFAATEGPIVTPSGSCAAMVEHHYPALCRTNPG